jgi:hypothetical protein
MGFNRAAHRSQVARILTHTAGEDVWLKLLGKGAEFPAAIARDQPKGTQVSPDVGVKALELVTIARDVRDPAGALIFATLPREGQHFKDRAGRTYRIQEDRSVSHSATLVFACTAS